MNKFALLALLVIFVSACANKPKVDTTPKNPTVVINAKGTVNADVLPDYTFKQKVYTRGDKRRISNDYEYDSWVMDKMLGGDYTSIFRMDKNLLWELHDEEYWECPLGGCGSELLARLEKEKGEEESFDYDPEAESCPLTITKNSFDVKETGQTRTLSGYSTKEYHAKWMVEYQDQKGNKDLNTLNIVYWNTVPTKEINEAWEVHEQATRAYRTAVKENNNPLGVFISDELFDALSAFSGDTAKDNKDWNNEVTRKLATAKGYPISIKMEWFMNRKACPEPEKKKEKKGFDWSNPLDSIKDSAQDMADKAVKDYFAPDPKKPIFHYVYEIKSVGLQPVNDSVFNVPKDYKLLTRK